MTIVSSKGQMGLEILWVIVVLVVIGLGLIFGIAPLTELNDDMQSEDDLSDDAKAFSDQVVGDSPSLWDNLFFFFMILLWIFIVIAGYLSSNNPVFAVVTIIFVVISFVIAIILANAYQDATTTDVVDSFADSFPKTNWIIEHLLVVSIFMGLSFMFVMYGGSRL